MNKVKLSIHNVLNVINNNLLIARAKINESLQKHFADAKKATKHCIQSISDELFAKHLISDSVKESPTYQKILDEFESGICPIQSISELENRYEEFLRCLKCDGGPIKDTVDRLYTDWKIIREQCKEGKQQQKSKF